MKDIDGIHEILATLQPHWKEIESDFDRHNGTFLKLYEADHDAIGRVLKTHLVIENFINDFLVSHYELEDLQALRLGFYQKALLLPSKGSAAAFIRPGILQLNAVRNKFGHSLNHEIQQHEISAIYEALNVARSGVQFKTALDAIEAFAPIACAFLSVPPKHLQDLFVSAFSKVHSHLPETVLHEE